MVESICPHCGIEADGNMNSESGLGDVQPNPGDVSLCWHCGGISIYETPPERRKATEAEIVNIPNLGYLIAMMKEAPSIEVLSVELGRRATDER